MKIDSHYNHLQATAERLSRGDFAPLLPAQRLAAHRAQNQMDGMKHTGLAGHGYRLRTAALHIDGQRWGLA